MIDSLLSRLADVRGEALRRCDGVLVLAARTRAHAALCPACGVVSRRVRGRYRRRLSGLPSAAWPVLTGLTARRFFCHGPCPAATFAEQAGGLTPAGMGAAAFRRTLW